MYSQGEEEEVLAGLFDGEIGRFLDIGAHDGRTFSNTLALAERGWSGVCVEPAPSLVARLLVTHAAREQVEVASVAVVPDAPGWTTLWDTDTDCVSTLDTDHRDTWSDSAYAPLAVYTVSLSSLLRRFGYAFDFISIDTEGTSVDLAEALPLERMEALRVICVERDRAVELPGFEPVWKDENNVILQRV